MTAVSARRPKILQQQPLLSRPRLRPTMASEYLSNLEYIRLTLHNAGTDESPTKKRKTTKITPSKRKMKEESEDEAEDTMPVLHDDNEDDEEEDDEQDDNDEA